MIHKSILILSGVRGDTRRYRCFHTYEQLRLAGIPCELSHITDSGLPDKANRTSIIILHRVSLDGYTAKILEQVHQNGGICLLDVDDLVFYPPAFEWIDSPDFKDPVRASLYQEEMRRQADTLHACDAVLASTEFLAKQAASMGKPVRVHRNAFSLEMLALSEQAYRQVNRNPKMTIIGYASGTPTHDRDFQVAKPALEFILNQYPNTELWLIGPLNPGGGWEHLTSRIRILKWIPWRQLPFIEAQFDINLAPLVTTNPFAQSKSEIKYVEAGLVHVPTIASPSDAFSHAIQSSKNGYLAGDNQAWIDALCYLVERQETRITLGNNAFEDVLKKYHPATRSLQLIQTIEELFTEQQGSPFWEQEESDRFTQNLGILEKSPSKFWSSEQVEKKPLLTDMAIYTARHRGFKTLVRQLWVYLRRLLSPMIPY